MIGSLRGTLIDRDLSGGVLVDVDGVGYEVQVTGPTSATLGDLGTDVFLRVHTRVREDAITLFGFASQEERRCFDALIGAHGVGPSLAMALLTVHSPHGLRQIVAMEDTEALSQVPGVGKKTAARLMVELKAKFDVTFDDELVNISSTVATRSGSSERDDVTSALIGLGYAGDEIRTALAVLPADGSVEELVRLALRELSRADAVGAPR